MTTITNGVTQGISPKTLAAGALPLVAGLVILVLDLTGLVEVDDALWIGLLGISPVAAGAAATAETGTVTDDLNEPK